MPIVAMPDGTQVNFPDDMPSEQIKGLISTKFPDAAKRAIQPPTEDKGIIGNFLDSQTKRGADLANVVQNPDNQAMGSRILQAAGDVGGTVGDLGAAAVQGANKINPLMNVAKAAYQQLPNSAKQSIEQPIADVSNAYNQNLNAYNQANPEAGKNYQAVRNLGNLLPIASPEVRAALNDSAQVAGSALKNVGSDIGTSIGSDAISGAKRMVIGRDADQILAGRLKGMDLAEIKGRLAQSSDMAMLPDVTGDEVKGLTRAVGTMTGGAKQIVSDALEGRSEGAVKRVSDALSKNISNVDTYFANLDDMANARASVAAPMYQKAFQKNQNIMTPEINRIIDTPAGQAALRSAANKMQNDMTLLGVPDKDLAEQAKLAGTYQPGSRGIASGLKLRTLDYMKRALDDQIGVAQRAGENDNARILTGLKNQLVSSLDRADITSKAGPNSLKPEGGMYARARKVYSDSFSLENAQQEGAQFSNRHPEEISKFIANASPSEKEAYRIGIRKNLQDIVNKTPDGVDPAKRIFGNTQKREQLKAAFGDGDNLKEFSSRMKEEIAAAQTKQKVLGGSRTDINLADDGQFIQEAMKVAQQGVTARLTHAIGTAVYNKYVGMTKRNANRLAYILTDKKQGLAALDRLIKAEKDKTQRSLIIKAVSDNKQHK